MPILFQKRGELICRKQVFAYFWAQISKIMNKSVLRVIGFLLFVTATLASCGSKYNKLKFHDPNEGNTEIYSEGTEPKQLAEPAKPDAAQGEEVKKIASDFRGVVEKSIEK